MALSLIKEHLDIETAATMYARIAIKRKGRNRNQVNVRCPFHNDRTPSLTLYFQTNSWYCHAGCGGGDQIDLVKKVLGKSIKETIYILINDLQLKRDGLFFGNKKLNQIKNEKTYRKKLLNNFHERVNNHLNWLLEVKATVQNIIKEVKTLEELEDEYICNLHHLVPRIEGWLDDLISSDYREQYFSLLESKRFFKEDLHKWLKMKR